MKWTTVQLMKAFSADEEALRPYLQSSATLFQIVVA